jgi:hypothetical protein
MDGEMGVRVRPQRTPISPLFLHEPEQLRDFL